MNYSENAIWMDALMVRSADPFSSSRMPLSGSETDTVSPQTPVSPLVGGRHQQPPTVSRRPKTTHHIASRSKVAMKNSMRSVTVLLAALALATTAKAQLVLFDTGVGANNTTLLPNGATDSHWSFVASSPPPTAGQAVVLTNQLPGTYFTDLDGGVSDSKWVWSTGDGSQLGFVTFSQTFNLSGFIASTAKITGDWGVDNNGIITLNGLQATGSGFLSLQNSDPNNFKFDSEFTITGNTGVGFLPGTNTLSFVTENTSNVGALNVSDLGLTATAAVPEIDPGSAASALACLGSGVMMLIGRRRKPDRA
jgi:hypothetical protein